MRAAVIKPLAGLQVRELVAWTVIAATVAAVLANDWLAAVAVLVLALAWQLLREPEGPPVLAFAFSFQWLQVTLGVFYFGIVGRSIATITRSDYRPMVLIGLVGLLSLLLGLVLGKKLVKA